MDLHCRTKRFTNVVLLVAFFACLGCSDAVKLIQETETGGVVTYLFKEERGGAMFSPFRSQAFEAMKQKCPSGYTIMKEGETRGSHSVAGFVEATEDEVRNRRWAMQFRCKVR